MPSHGTYTVGGHTYRPTNTSQLLHRVGTASTPCPSVMLPLPRLQTCSSSTMTAHHVRAELATSFIRTCHTSRTFMASIQSEQSTTWQWLSRRMAGHAEHSLTCRNRHLVNRVRGRLCKRISLTRVVDDCTVAMKRDGARWTSSTVQAGTRAYSSYAFGNPSFCVHLLTRPLQVRTHASADAWQVCENRDGWPVAWGLCGCMLSRFSTALALPFTLL